MWFDTPNTLRALRKTCNLSQGWYTGNVFNPSPHLVFDCYRQVATVVGLINFDAIFACIINAINLDSVIKLLI